MPVRPRALRCVFAKSPSWPRGRQSRPIRLAGQLRSLRAHSVGNCRRHRVGRQRDLWHAHAAQLASLAIQGLHRLADALVHGRQAGRQGVLGVHVRPHSARRSGVHPAQHVRQSDALRRDPRATGVSPSTSNGLVETPTGWVTSPVSTTTRRSLTLRSPPWNISPEESSRSRTVSTRDSGCQNDIGHRSAVDRFTTVHISN